MGEYAPDIYTLQTIATKVVNGSSQVLFNVGTVTAKPLEFQYDWYRLAADPISGYPKAVWVLPDLAVIDVPGQKTLLEEAPVATVTLYKQETAKDGSLSYRIVATQSERADPVAAQYPGLTFYSGAAGSIGSYAYLDLSNVKYENAAYFVQVTLVGSAQPWPVSGRYVLASTSNFAAGADVRSLAFGANYIQTWPLVYNLSARENEVKIATGYAQSILFNTDAKQFQAALDVVYTGAKDSISAISDFVKIADNTTSVASMAYQFFTGKIPSKDGFTYLVSPQGPNPNNINSAYYQSFNLENRYINFSVNLGKIGEGRASFESAYGPLSLSAATKKAYGVIFGTEPTDSKVGALLANGRDQYFASYGGDGLNGIGTKAAMVGWLLAEAEKADIGVMARSNAAFLTDLADGANFAVNIVGAYGKADWNYAGG